MSNKTEMIYQKLGITLPQVLVTQMDEVRGDIPRSRYLMRLVEQSLSCQSKKVAGNMVPANPATLSPIVTGPEVE